MSRTTILSILALIAAALAIAAACSKSGGGGSAPDPSDPLVITITAAGANPRTLTVTQGQQVTFVNKDTVVHEMYSDPHPEHTDCPEFDAVGHLNPGVVHQTTNLVITRTCGFHDHLNPFNNALKGSITITQAR